MNNFNLTQIPERTIQPRESGLTMVMDKGLSTREVGDFLSMNKDYVDIIKLGFGTSYLSPNLTEKIELYHQADMKVYLGGTLFEAYIARKQFNDYLELLEKLNLKCVEISDGSLDMDHDEKCAYISTFAKRGFTVLSEVGSKDASKIIAPYKWINLMQKELNAGAWKVIAEAREGGNVGIFRGTGEVRSGLIEEILTRIPNEKILWEAPKKAQQVWFVKLLGSNVNLGNIAPNESIPLETLRLGLRADTFDLYLNK